MQVGDNINFHGDVINSNVAIKGVIRSSNAKRSDEIESDQVEAAPNGEHQLTTRKSMAKLRQTFINLFSDSEIRDLCFDLDIDYESLPGQGKADKVRELLTHMKRKRELSSILAECGRLRPEVDWSV